MEDRLLDIVIIWAPVVLLVLSVINACTEHYTKFNGVLRVVMAVIERLSFLASRRSGAVLKRPLTSVVPDPALERMADVRKRLEAMARLKEAGHR